MNIVIANFVIAVYHGMCVVIIHLYENVIENYVTGNISDKYGNVLHHNHFKTVNQRQSTSISIDANADTLCDAPEYIPDPNSTQISDLNPNPDENDEKTLFAEGVIVEINDINIIKFILWNIIYCQTCSC